MTEQHDRDELVELMSRYASMPDTKDWDELPHSVLCDEFTADFSSLSVGAPAAPISRDAWCRQSKRAFAGWNATHHAITNHRIAVDGDRATIWAHVRVEHWAPHESRPADRTAGWSSASTTTSPCEPPTAGGSARSS